MAINVDDEILQDFLVEAGEILDSLSEQLVELEQRPTDKNLLNSVFRGFHTVKGGAGFLNITPLVDVCHRAEDVFNTLRQGERQVDAALMDVVLKVLDIANDMMNAVRAGQDPTPASPHLLETLKGLAQPQAPSEKPTAPAPPAPAAPVTHEADEIDKEYDMEAPKEAAAHQADTTVRVDTKRLDDIMNLVGELVLVRNRLATLKETVANEEVAQAVGNLDVVTSDLQAAVMKTRMQPIKKVFGRFPRVVRDLSRALNKDIHLELVGEDTDLDKNLVEALADPLVHLVRNSIDHG